MPRAWFCIALLFAPLFVPVDARAVEVRAGLEQRAFALRAPLSLLLSQLRYPGLQDPTQTSRLAYQLRGTAELEGRPVDSLGLRLGLDTGLLELGTDGALLDGRAPADQLPRTLLLGETWGEWQAGDGALLVRAGKWRARLGEGAIFDAYAFGVMLDLDLGLALEHHPWQARAQVLFPSGALAGDTFRSPLLGAELGYRFGPRASARGLAAVYVDHGAVGPLLADALLRGQAESIEGAFDQVRDVLDDNPCPTDGRRPNFREAVSCFEQGLIRAANEGRLGYAAQTRGQVGWTGASGRLGDEGWSVEGLLLYGFGALDVTFTPDGELTEAFIEGLERLPRRGQPLADEARRRLPRQRRAQLSSWLAQVSAKWSPHPDLELDGFLLGISGDDGILIDDAAATYRAFVSLAPLLAHTSLFFGGGAATAVAAPTASALAPDAAGLVSGGLGATIYLQDRFRLRGLVAAMQALRPNPTGRRFQGVEVDLLADAVLTSWLMLYVDTAVFVPGPYFGDTQVALQGIFGASLRY